MQYVTLYNGVKMPILGFGVYQISKEQWWKKENNKNNVKINF